MRFHFFHHLLHPFYRKEGLNEKEFDWLLDDCNLK